MSLKGTIFEPMFGEQSPTDEYLDAADELMIEAKEQGFKGDDRYDYTKLGIEDRVRQKSQSTKRFQKLVKSIDGFVDDPRTTTIRFAMRTFARAKEETKARVLESISIFEDAAIRLAARFTVEVRNREDIVADRLLQRMGSKDRFNDKLQELDKKVKSLFDRLRKTARVG